jgi:hypothetical protein
MYEESPILLEEVESGSLAVNKHFKKLIFLDIGWETANVKADRAGIGLRTHPIEKIYSLTSSSRSLNVFRVKVSSNTHKT